MGPEPLPVQPIKPQSAGHEDVGVSFQPTPRSAQLLGCLGLGPQPPNHALRKATVPSSSRRITMEDHACEGIEGICSPPPNRMAMAGF